MLDIKGVLLYCDGGAKTNPGKIGSGIHGYVFDYKTGTKGLGINSLATQYGYYTANELASALGVASTNKKELKTISQLDLSKVDSNLKEELISLNTNDKPNDVNVVAYLDGRVSYKQEGTNNVAELGAIIAALEWVLEQEDYKLFTVRLKTDSNYVVEGINNNLTRWRKLNYRRSDGSELANRELWIKISDLLVALEQQDILVYVDWVKGHNGILGNELADRLATIAYNVEASNLEEDIVKQFIISEANSYFTKTYDKPVLLYQRYILFNPGAFGQESNNLCKIDKRMHFTCHLGNEEEEPLRYLGSKHSETGYALVYLEDIKGVDIIYDLECKQALLLDYEPCIVALDTKVALAKDTLKEYNTVGLASVMDSGKPLYNLSTVGSRETSKAITEVIRPAYLSYRVERIYEDLYSLYNAYVEQDSKLVLTDITNDFYDTVIKSKKGVEYVTYSLTSKIKTGAHKHSVVVKYSEEASKLAKIILTLGQDIPDRNTLKRLEAYQPKVTLLALPLAPYSFRYATLLETSLGWLLSCGAYSNSRILDSSAKL